MENGKRNANYDLKYIMCVLFTLRFVTEEHLLEVEVEIGMQDGMETKFVAEGEPHIDGEPGDLLLHIKTMPHNQFERRNEAGNIRLET